MEAISESLRSTVAPDMPLAAAAADSTATTTSPLPNSHDFPDGPADFPVDSDDGDVAWLNINELSGDDANELQKCVDTCVERWKAAGPEARKKMFALFAIAGIFISVCRHGHVLVMCDMIRSGELYCFLFVIVAAS
jgi:hypothetical protein